MSRDSIVVSTSRCGRENPGSNPGHGRIVNFLSIDCEFSLIFGRVHSSVISNMALCAYCGVQ